MTGERVEHPECHTAHFDYSGSGPPLSHIHAFEALRSLGPFVWSTGGVRGFWVFTTYELIRDALRQPDLFSSTVNHELIFGAPDTPVSQGPRFIWKPEMLDPPEHTRWRRMLAPHFASDAATRLEPAVRAMCVELIKRFQHIGSCELLRDLAWPYATSTFMVFMGLPLEELDMMLSCRRDICNPSGDAPNEVREFAAVVALQEIFSEALDDRETEPRDDLLTAALNWRIEGDPISREDLLSWCFMTFMGAVETIPIQLAYSFWFLADQPDLRQQLICDRSTIPSAVEEFLRCFAFLPLVRRVTRDADFHGCPLRKGETVVLPLAAATRDPAVFADATNVVLSRERNNHIAFGAGPHRCLGLHLARLELSIALEEWHSRISDYRLSDESIQEHGGIYGIESLSLRWDV